MRTILLILMMWAGLGLKAQWVEPCVDSTRQNQFYPCGSSFVPVCGCNAKSYMNECVAYNRAGVNRIEHSGVCQNDLFIFDFWPIPVMDHLNFHMQFASQQASPAQLTVVDMFGNIVYFKLLNNVGSDFPYMETIYLYGLQKGVYFMTVKTNSKQRIKRFIKI